MSRVNFNFYGIDGIKRGKCIECGKHGLIKERFEQSINPWNRKTPEQIYSEEKAKLNEWLLLPFKHRRCEETVTAPRDPKAVGENKKWGGV